MSGRGKPGGEDAHTADARAAVEAFDAAWATGTSAVTAGTEQVLNLGASAALAVGMVIETDELQRECLVVRPNVLPPKGASPPPAS